MGRGSSADEICLKVGAATAESETLRNPAGIGTVVRNAGGAFGSQLAVAIIVASAQAGTGVPAASGYISALILCAAATCAGAFVACATPRKNPR